MLCARMLSCDEFLAAWLRTPGVVVRDFCASAGLRRRRLCAAPRSGQSVRSARHQVLHVKRCQVPNVYVRFVSAIPIPELTAASPRRPRPPRARGRRHLATHRRPGGPAAGSIDRSATVARIRARCGINKKYTHPNRRKIRIKIND
jgi:hypothetical protein